MKHPIFIITALSLAIIVLWLWILHSHKIPPRVKAIITGAVIASPIPPIP